MRNRLNEDFRLEAPMKFRVQVGRNSTEGYIVKLNATGGRRDSSTTFRLQHTPDKRVQSDVEAAKQEDELFMNGTLQGEPIWQVLSKKYFVSYDKTLGYYWNLSELCRETPVEHPTSKYLSRAIATIQQLKQANPNKSKVDIIFENFIAPCVRLLNSEAHYGENRFSDEAINNIKQQVPDEEELASVYTETLDALEQLREIDPDNVWVNNADSLLNELADMTNSDEYAAKINELMHWAEDVGINEYSLRNIMAIRLQKPDAVRVWPLSDWRRSGRRPKADAKPIWILVNGGELGPHNREDANNKMEQMGAHVGDDAIVDHIYYKIIRTRVGDKVFLWKAVFYDWSDTEVIPGEVDRLPNPRPGRVEKDTSAETREAARYYTTIVALLQDEGVIGAEEAARLNHAGRNMFRNDMDANGNLANADGQPETDNTIVRNLGAVKDLIKRYAAALIEKKYKGDQGDNSKRWQNNVRFIGMQSEICAWTAMRMLGFTNMPNEMEDLASSGIDNRYVHATFNTLAGIAHIIAYKILHYNDDAQMAGGLQPNQGGEQAVALPPTSDDDDEMLEESVTGRKLAYLCGLGKEYDKSLNESINRHKDDFFDILDRITRY